MRTKKMKIIRLTVGISLGLSSMALGAIAVSYGLSDAVKGLSIVAMGISIGFLFGVLTDID